jgi:hypothetical protein
MIKYVLGIFAIRQGPTWFGGLFYREKQGNGSTQVDIA